MSGGRLTRWLGGLVLPQLALLVCVLLLFAGLGIDTVANMRHFGLRPGWGFLARPAGFAIGETPIAFSPSDSYARAVLAGLLNTVEVAAAGIVLATLAGLALAIARLSGNLLLSLLAQAYVELVRNTPLLLQLFFWSATLLALPPPAEAFHPLAGVFLSNRGVFLPGLAGGRLSVPELHGFNFSGGISLSPEFAALLAGLALNSAASIAEIVRGAVSSVPAGQWDAGRAVGLTGWQVMRLVILPQAARAALPALTSSYLSLAKNSSLAVAIGFPDLASVVGTIANQTGQAFETLAILIGAYLALSLSVAAAMDRYNRVLTARGG